MESSSLQSTTLHCGGFLVYGYLASLVTSIKTHCFVIMHMCGLSPFAFQRNLVQPFSQEPQRHGHHIPLRHTQNQRHPQPPSTTTLSYSTQLWLKSRYGLVVILLYLLPHMCKTLVKRNTTAVTVVTCVGVLATTITMVTCYFTWECCRATTVFLGV